MRKSCVSPVRKLITALVLVLLGPVTLCAEQVIIRTGKPYDQLVQKIRQAGGEVSHQYRYINAIAADIPGPALKAIQKQLPPGSVEKDLVFNLPQIARDPDDNPLSAEGQAEAFEALDEAGLAALPSVAPSAYLYNNALMNLGPLQSQLFYGQGIKVALIDTGIRPNFPHISLDGSVIGGEDFVNDGLGYSNSANDGHGTFVAGMVSANLNVTFASGNSLLAAIKAYCPTCVLQNNRTVSMLGSAPLSSIYALRVIPPNAGTPMSRILAAMEKVVTLRDAYDQGNPETRNPNGSYNALNIKVCNMSLGGSTTYPGRSVLDEMTEVVLEHDIVLTVAAANAGPSGSTIATPASGFGSLTVGAGSSAVHERILREFTLGVGKGLLYRPFGGTQTAYFSSRGPTPDGRTGPNLVANGFASFGMGLGSTSTLNIDSGTSYAAPSVSGVAAILRQAVPGATARQIRNALIMSANPNLLEDGSGPFDRGAGYVDGGEALTLLQAGVVPDTPGIEGGTNTNVKVNLLQQADVRVYEGNVTRRISGLLPGQRFETFYRVTPNTSAVVVTVSGLTPGNPQNTYVGGDGLLLGIHSPKFTAVGQGDYSFKIMTVGGTFTSSNPEPGLLRVTLCGRWTNASPIGATVNIYSVYESTPQLTLQGKIEDGDLFEMPIQIPAGTAKLSARLEWDRDWGAYPANDIDLYLVRPDGALITSAATLNDPEFTEINNPLPGTWTAILDGYAVFGGADNYKLRIMIDDQILR